MQIAQNILLFISGIGAFLFGIKVMGESVNKSAGPKLTKSLHKMTNNRAKGLLFGFSFTGVMQSSSATIALTVGFVGAGIMTFTQTVAVVFGANIGTVITEFLISFEIFKISYIFAAMTGIGTFVFIFSKKEKVRDIAKIFIGIGLMFIGIKVMQDATRPLGESAVFRDLIGSLKSPTLILLIGFVFTVLVQSSLGAIVILMGIATSVNAAGGDFTLFQAAFFVLGANIGTTVTGFIASTGSVEGKRVALTHLLFNLIAALVFSIILVSAPFAQSIAKITPVISLQIALFNLFVKLGTTAILIGFTPQIAKLAKKIVKDRRRGKYLSEFTIDESVLKIPTLALHKMNELNTSVIEQISQMLDMAMEELRTGKSEGINKMVAKRDYLYAANVKMREQVQRIMQQPASGFEVDITDQIKINDQFASIIKHTYVFYENITAFIDVKADGKLLGGVEKFYQKVSYMIEIGKALLSEESDDQKRIDNTIEIIELEESLSVELVRAKRDHLAKAKDLNAERRVHSIYLNMLLELEDIGGKISGICAKTR